ncbi:MAG: hypothetical protein ACLGSA_10430 [Acidobacteriota bacterium]
MDREGHNSHAVCIAILMSIICLLAVSVPRSSAFVIDKFKRTEDGTIKHNAHGTVQCSDDSAEPTRHVLDTSCVSEELNSLSLLSGDELVPKLKAMGIERQVDLYLCSSRAGLYDVAGELRDILSSRLPNDLEYLKSRLIDEKGGDYRLADLLSIFILYGVEEALKVFEKKKDYLTIDELPFTPEVSRLLVSKAGDIKNGKTRDFLLDYLIPLLPYEEAVARQAQREEAQKKIGK